MKNIAVLVSGGGTNLQALIDAQKDGIIKSGKITCVISSNPDAYALERARNNNIDTAVIRRKDFETLTGKRYAYLKGVNAHSEMALYVDTFEEVDLQYQHAIENGASALMEPTTEPWGQRTCFIADPEGNIIEIGSWNKPYEEKDK